MLDKGELNQHAINLEGVLEKVLTKVGGMMGKKEESQLQVEKDIVHRRS